jgi:hypothetical protein
MKQKLVTFFPLMMLVGLCVLAYVWAQWFMLRWWPEKIALIIRGTLLSLVVVPLFYRYLNRRYAEGGKRPYFVFFLDPILAIVPYFFLLFALITPLPRFAVVAWGEPSTGTISALTQETGIDFQPIYKVTYYFYTETDAQYVQNSYVSEAVFAPLSLWDTVPIYWLPQFPQASTLPDLAFMTNQALLLLWSMAVLVGWVGCVWLATAVRHLPAPKETAVSLMQQYGIDTILTVEDDLELWEGVLQSHFPPLQEIETEMSGVRFGVGQPASTAKLKIQPTIGYGFARIDQDSARVIDTFTDEVVDADFDEALIRTVPMLLLYLNELHGHERPYRSIVVERPSKGKKRVLVYTAVKRRNNTGYGATCFWEYLPDGSWQQTKERLNWWMIG